MNKLSGWYLLLLFVLSLLTVFQPPTGYHTFLQRFDPLQRIHPKEISNLGLI